jgi:hypothetical protein
MAKFPIKKFLLSINVVDPDLDLHLSALMLIGPSRATMTHKNRKTGRNFIFEVMGVLSFEG